MNAHPSKSKLSSSNQLNPNKMANIFAVPEFSHQVGKILGFRIPRKHSAVNHCQNRPAVFDKFANLRYLVLELNYGKASPMISPEVVACSGRDFHASFDSLFFSNKIQLSTCRRGKELNI
jgi:hypothetical protein